MRWKRKSQHKTLIYSARYVVLYVYCRCWIYTDCRIKRVDSERWTGIIQCYSKLYPATWGLTALFNWFLSNLYSHCHMNKSGDCLQQYHSHNSARLWKKLKYSCTFITLINMCLGYWNCSTARSWSDHRCCHSTIWTAGKRWCDNNVSSLFAYLIVLCYKET